MLNFSSLQGVTPNQFRVGAGLLASEAGRFNAECESNLVNFICDVRKELDVPLMPLVIGETAVYCEKVSRFRHGVRLEKEAHRR